MRRALPALYATRYPQLTSVAVILAAAATACGPTHQHPNTAPPQTSSAPSSPTAAPAPSPQTGVSNGRTYTVTTAVVDGATPDGHGRWHTRAGHLVGLHAAGDPVVIAAFDNAADASDRGLLDHARADGRPAWWDWTFEVRPTVTFLPTAISELLVGTYYATQAAHPVNYVSTIVIDSRTAQPIALNTMFSNEAVGLQRLSEQTKRLWPAAYGQGNQPREENFANWIPTPAGMEIHFADYQFGHGLPVITIPWIALADVLAPDMTALTHP